MENAKQSKLNTIADALGEAIKEATQQSSLGGIPSGHLYAALMGMLDLSTYELLIANLVSRRLVRKEPSHLLVWIGK